MGGAISETASGSLLGLNVVNHGRRPVTIAEVGLMRRPPTAKLAFPQPRHGKLPRTLAEGESQLFLLMERPRQPFGPEATEGIRPDKAYARDAIGRLHTTKLPPTMRDELFR